MYTISIIVETVYTVPQTVYSIQRVNEKIEYTAGCQLCSPRTLCLFLFRIDID